MAGKKILMAASEMEPFARTGALADSILALSGTLAAQGHEVSVALPYYHTIRENKALKVKSTGVSFPVTLGGKICPAEIYESRAPNGVQVFLIARDEFFDRSGLYGVDGRDYQDNAERFIFYTKCVLELARRMEPAPEILHAHDWQAALLPVFVRARQENFHTVLTIHNPAYQGNFWSYDFALTNLPSEYFSPRGVEFYGSMNCIKAGILFADAVVLPGNRAVSDAKTPEYGCGLDGVMREHASKLHGIPEGVDEHAWNPAKDNEIPAKYRPENLSGKTTCRKALLAELALDDSPRGPVLLLLSHVIDPEGFEILLPALDRLLWEDTRVVVLGRGTQEHEAALLLQNRRHAKRFRYLPAAAPEMIRRALAGADVLLVPARFEPSGHEIMRALKYGTVPLVQACGGLAQLVRDEDAVPGRGNGFVFYVASPDALVDKLRRTARFFEDRAAWTALAVRGMTQDFSWAACAQRLGRLYDSICGTQ